MSLVNFTDPRMRQSSKKAPVSQGLKISARGKQLFMECTPTSSKVINKPKQNILAGTISKRTSLNKDCQVDKMAINLFREVGMDTLQDRPCCCLLKEPDSPDKYGSNDRCVANAFSELITPMLINQGVAQGNILVPILNLVPLWSVVDTVGDKNISLHFLKIYANLDFSWNKTRMLNLMPTVTTAQPRGYKISEYNFTRKVQARS